MSATPEQIAADLDRWVTYMSVGRENDAYQPEGVRLLTQAAALIRAQTEALKPFADLLEPYDKSRPDNWTGRVFLNMRSLRRASAAFKGEV